MKWENKGDQRNRPKKSVVSRRDFFKGSGIVAAGTALGASGILSACSNDPAGEAASSAEGIDPSSSEAIEIYETDVLVLGTGAGGSLAALQAYSENASVLVVDKGPYGSAGVTGMNWSAGCFVFQEIPQDVTQPPYNSGGLTWYDPLTNQKVSRAVQDFVGQSPDAWNIPLVYARLGTPSFDRNPDGTVHDPFPPGMGFGARVGIYPRNNLDYVNDLNIKVVDNTMITDFFISNGVCIGAIGVHVNTGTYRIFKSKATVIASGGSAQNYGWLRTGAVSINTPDNTGDTISAAMRHGCSMINPEFFAYDLISFVPESLGAGFGAGIGADSTNQGLVCDVNGEYIFEDAAGAGAIHRKSF